MATMPVWLNKPEEMYRVDEFFGVDDPEELRRRYDDTLERLGYGSVESKQRFWEESPLDLGAEALRHFGSHWMDSGYWPNVPGSVVAEKIRAGFIGAILTARDAGLPLSMAWVAADPDYGSTLFEVDHVAGPRVVTLIIATPWPKLLSREDVERSAE